MNAPAHPAPQSPALSVYAPSATHRGFQPGERVRRIGAPEVTGTIQSAPVFRDGSVRQRVSFDDGSTQFTDPASLERLPAFVDAVDQLGRGEWAPPAKLRANLLHQKLDGRLNEVLFSMEASNTNFLAYQFKPVLTLLESPINAILLADEVGLGKTISAGIIWTELRARENARYLLVVCPPHLVTKWRMELKRRFGVDAQAANADQLLEKLEEAQRGSCPGFAIVASYHSARPANGWRDEPRRTSSSSKLARKLDEWANNSEPFVDLLIMDEAAIMRNATSLTSQLGSLLNPVCKYKVYLSATPVHTQSQNLFTLLHHLDPDNFEDFQTFAAILRANTPLVRLRESLLNEDPDRDHLRNLIAEARRFPMLQNSEVLSQLDSELARNPDLSNRRVCSLLAHQANRANLLSHVITRTRRRDVDLNPVTREVKTLVVPLTPDERNLYHAVTEAILEYSSINNISAGFLTVMPQRRVASCMAAALEGICGPDSGATEERNPDFDTGDAPAAAQGPLLKFVRERIRGLFTVESLRTVDSKYAQLRDALRDHWRQHPGGKIVLFAFFKPTLRYLAERLQADGMGSFVLTGDEPGDKQEVINAFAASSNRNILLSSEVGSEGLDLQFASVLINYDLPWNPMVVAQRIGRIHRIGQKASRILVLNLVCEDTVDERIHNRLYVRLDLFQNTIGDHESILGETISQLSKDLLTLRLTPEQQEELIERIALATQNIIFEEQQLEQNAGLLAAHGDYLIQRVSEAHKRGDWIKGGDLETYVVGFFTMLFPQTAFRGMNAAERLYEIEMDASTACEFGNFLHTRNLRGMTRINADRSTRIRFDHQVFKSGDAAVETINHAHPLVRFINHVLRTKRLAPAVSIAAELPGMHRPEGLSPGIYVFVSQRWKAEGLRSFEKLHHQVVHLETGTLLEEDHAIRLIETTALEGGPIRNFETEDGSVLCELSERARQLEADAHFAFEDFLNAQKREDTDRKNILIYGVNQYELRRRRSLEETIERHLERGRNSLAKACRAQLDNLIRTSEAKRLRYQGKAVTGGAETIAAGFILVN